MAPNRITLALLAICLGTAACAWKIRSMSYDGVVRTPKPSDHPIPMIADTSSIGAPYVIIGLVEADPGNMANLGEREMLNAMRREARRMGGDALVNLRRPLSNYSRVRTPRDFDHREKWPDHMPSYRWVAEVISYDILSATQPGATRGERASPPAPNTGEVSDQSETGGLSTR